MTETGRASGVAVSLAGIFPPIPTPFGETGDVDHDALCANLERWHDYDLSGYVVLGSNGETALLSAKEKQGILRAARSAIPQNKLLIVGTGCESARQTIELTAFAAQAGADAALVLTPHFYGMKQANLVSYYAAVADASPIPVILYNVPKFTHMDMDAATIAQIAMHPNVIGIKDSGGNITKIADTVQQTDDAFHVLAGSAGFLLASLVLGAVGGIVALANVAPQQAIDIYRLYKEGLLEEAAELQRRMIPVNAAITARFGVPGLKAALDILGWRGGPVRLPLLDLGLEDRHTIESILRTGAVL